MSDEMTPFWMIVLVLAVAACGGVEGASAGASEVAGDAGMEVDLGAGGEEDALDGPLGDAAGDAPGDAAIVGDAAADDAVGDGDDAAGDDAADADVAEGAPRFVSFWGGRGREPGQFLEPSSVEIDSAGFVYVAGHEHRFQKFTAEGELVAIYGSPGPGDGQFNHPHGLAVDRRRGDLIYVGDQENHRLQVFTSEGVFVRQWGDALFKHIHDVGIDPSTGDVLVGDLESNVVRRFTAQGEEVWMVGGPGQAEGLFDGVWGMSTDSAGDIYIADTNNRRVQVLDRDGGFVRQWEGYGGERFVKPTGVFVDDRDVVHVCDSLAEAILVFDREGNPLERWSLPQIVGFRTEPEDIVIDAAGVNIYVAEVLQHRVLRLRR